MVRLLVRAHQYNQALLVVKGTSAVPDAKERLASPIDIWWVVHDGGLQLLLTTILRKSAVWMHCPVRVFCVVQANEDALELRTKVADFLYKVRIDVAEVKIVVLDADMEVDEFNRYRRGGRPQGGGWELNRAVVAALESGDVQGGTNVTEDIVDEPRLDASSPWRPPSTPVSRANSFSRGSSPAARRGSSEVHLRDPSQPVIASVNTTDLFTPDELAQQLSRKIDGDVISGLRQRASAFEAAARQATAEAAAAAAQAQAAAAKAQAVVERARAMKLALERAEKQGDGAVEAVMVAFAQQELKQQMIEQQAEAEAASTEAAAQEARAVAASLGSPPQVDHTATDEPAHVTPQQLELDRHTARLWTKALAATRVLNKLMHKYSAQQASLMLVNLPVPGEDSIEHPELYMEQVDLLTQGLPLVLLVAGVRDFDTITMHS